MLIQKIGYKQLYPDIELTIAQDGEQFPDDEKLKQMSSISFNTISTTFKDDHDTFVDFKVIELILIFQSLLIALITGIPYLFTTITHRCSQEAQMLALGSLILFVIPSVTFCSHNFKMSLRMITFVTILIGIIFLIQSLILLNFFFSSLILIQLKRDQLYVDKIRK